MTVKPVRLRLSRAKGFRLQALSLATNGLPAVNVARPSLWGNRWRIGDTVQRFSAEKICETFTIETAAQAVACFREEYECHLANPKAEGVLRAALAGLRGKNLSCWCGLPGLDQPDICHAAVLLEMVSVPARPALDPSPLSLREV